jgi:hypothetical protein
VASTDVLGRLHELCATADGERKEERGFAASNSIAHYVCGGAGVVGGALAALTASGGSTSVTVVAGGVAAIGSGLLTAFKFDDKARKRFRQERRYKSVVDHAKNEYLRVQRLDDEEAVQAIEELQKRLDDVRKSAEP